MRAVKRATDYVLSAPVQAYADYIEMKPIMGTSVNRKIFERSYAYFSKDLKNVARDWEKVTKYGKRLGVLDESFLPNYTNKFLGWAMEDESKDPMGDQKRYPHSCFLYSEHLTLFRMVDLQKDVAANGGFLRLGDARTAVKA